MAINQAAQVSVKTFSKRHVEVLNKAIKYARSTADLVLKYHALDRTTLYLCVYADACIASNDDKSSQLGFIVLLCDVTDRCHVLTNASKKSRRVVRPIKADEVYAFANAFDEAFIVKHDLERVYKQHLPLTMLTDSKLLFDVITRASHTTEKRRMIDTAAAREAYNRNETASVGLVKSENKLADELTKPGLWNSLDNILRTSVNRNPVEQ